MESLYILVVDTNLFRFVDGQCALWPQFPLVSTKSRSRATQSLKRNTTKVMNWAVTVAYSFCLISIPSNPRKILHELLRVNTKSTCSTNYEFHAALDIIIWWSHPASAAHNPDHVYKNLRYRLFGVDFFKRTLAASMGWLVNSWRIVYYKLYSSTEF